MTGHNCFDPHQRDASDPCAQFDARMHWLIDTRGLLASDDGLQGHANQCDRCHGRMKTWLAFERVSGQACHAPDQATLWLSENVDVESTNVRDGSKEVVSKIHRRLPLTLAASVCLTLCAVAYRIGTSDHGDDPASLNDVGVPRIEREIAGLEFEPLFLAEPVANASFLPDSIDPTLWWQDFSNRDWLAEAMPAVESMGESVAPIGRSIRRAFAPISIVASDQTS